MYIKFYDENVDRKIKIFLKIFTVYKDDSNSIKRFRYNKINLSLLILFGVFIESHPTLAA